MGRCCSSARLMSSSSCNAQASPSRSADSVASSMPGGAALVETGRAVAAPPGMDEATLSALREGLACALQDEELINLAEEQQRPISPLSGEEMADLIRQVLDSPEAFQQLVTEAS